MDAAEIGSIDCIRTLAKRGADINGEDKEKHTALSYCIDFVSKKEPKFYDAAKELIKLGALPNYSGKFANRTILHCAAAQGDFELVKELVEQCGAVISVYDNESKTPLNYAEDNKHSEIVTYLTEKLAAQSSSCVCLLLSSRVPLFLSLPLSRQRHLSPTSTQVARYYDHPL